ncbi:MAG: AAA family ATPase [Rhodobacterales bacterium]|nr:AAA family ATPase [Rhodobacterales bacterium]
MSTTTRIIANLTMALDATLILQSAAATKVTAPKPAALTVPTEATAVVLPPLPPTWRRPSPPAPPLKLFGVGLNVFGLRTVPLVDRVRPRDQMWDALTDAIETQSTRLVVLHGASGNGKSRLAQWISRRAHEVGNANVLRCIHGPTQGPMDGLRSMLARHFSTNGLERAHLDEYLSANIHAPDAVDLPALIEFLNPADAKESGGIRLVTQEERWVIVERVFVKLATHRPLVVWLDDVQWGSDALGFAQWLLNRRPVGAILFLCTAQSEALAEREQAQAALNLLVSHPHAQLLPVHPLAPEDRIDLVRALLGLEGELAQQLADRTAGNPLFTVQLVGDWVSRGVLVPGRDGFQLRAGERAVLPDNLHQVWSERVERLLAERPLSHRHALEIAAALGQEVDATEWGLVCANVKITVPVDLVEKLIEARLAAPAQHGWAFSHGMLRESLQRIAREAGRWTGHNEACAIALGQLRQPSLEARLGQHWYQANNWSSAAELLRRGAVQRVDNFDAARAVPLLRLSIDALRRGGVPERDIRWGEVWLERARCLQQLGQSDDSLRDAQRVRTRALRHGWRSQYPKAGHRIGDNLRIRGDTAGSRASYAESIDAFEKHPKLDQQGLADALVSMSNIDILGGDLNAARAALKRAEAVFTTMQSAAGLSRVLRFYGDIARQEPRYEDARALFARSLIEAQKTGVRADASSALHGIAEIDRLTGKLDAAEEGYRHCIDMADAIGRNTSITQLNLGLCLIARGDYNQAHALIFPVFNEWAEQQRRGYVAVAHAALLPISAGRNDWLALDTHLSGFISLAASTGMTDIDSAHGAELAGNLAKEAGQVTRAAQCWEIAASTWEALNEVDRADAVLARIRELETL